MLCQKHFENKEVDPFACFLLLLVSVCQDTFFVSHQTIHRFMMSNQRSQSRLVWYTIMQERIDRDPVRSPIDGVELSPTDNLLYHFRNAVFDKISHKFQGIRESDLQLYEDEFAFKNRCKQG